MLSLRTLGLGMLSLHTLGFLTLSAALSCFQHVTDRFLTKGMAVSLPLHLPTAAEVYILPAMVLLSNSNKISSSLKKKKNLTAACPSNRSDICPHRSFCACCRNSWAGSTQSVLFFAAVFSAWFWASSCYRGNSSICMSIPLQKHITTCLCTPLWVNSWSISSLKLVTLSGIFVFESLWRHTPPPLSVTI